MKTRKKKGQNERESLAPTFHLDVKYEGKIGQSSMDGNMGGNMSGKWKKDGEKGEGGPGENPELMALMTIMV